jgi:hypothetical protein
VGNQEEAIVTKKHLEAIAKAIKAEQTAVAVREDTRYQIALNIAGVMKESNPRFDISRFMAAAGFNLGVRP